MTVERHGPYTRIDVTAQELRVITWSLRQAVTALDAKLEGDLKRLADGKAQIDLLLEYLADAARMPVLEGGRAD